jgi:nickel-type superoxide dismutase maturation protease
MAPTLRSGDWLLVDPMAYRGRTPRVGELVVAPDPRDRSRLLVKRVSAVDRAGRITLAGDNAAASTDPRAFGPIAAPAITGRPWFRYWPPARIGPVGGTPTP